MGISTRKRIAEEQYKQTEQSGKYSYEIQLRKAKLSHFKKKRKKKQENKGSQEE